VVSGLNLKLSNTINEYIRPLTFPIAIKIYKEGENIPFEYKTPTGDFKNKLAICQGMTMARRHGWTLGFRREDLACPLAQVILGYVEEPEFMKSGKLICPLYAENMKAASKINESITKMPYPNTQAVVIAPLHKAEFEPDVIAIYGSIAQIIKLIAGALYKTGGYITSRFTGHCSCSGEIVVPYLENKYNLVMPDGGSKFYAFTTDYELVFALPNSKVESFAQGIAHVGQKKKLGNSFEQFVMGLGAEYLDNYLTARYSKSHEEKLC
jgi:uncharacterized protein (DUF169 family)